MSIQFKALPTEHVRALQRGGSDAYGHTPERKISDGDGMPCRHCLRNIADGDAYLILAYRPFPNLQPYAETGPIFLHAEECERAARPRRFPKFLKARTILCAAMAGMTASSMAAAGSSRPRQLQRGPRRCSNVTTSPTCMSARRATTATSAGLNGPEPQGIAVREPVVLPSHRCGRKRVSIDWPTADEPAAISISRKRGFGSAFLLPVLRQEKTRRHGRRADGRKNPDEIRRPEQLSARPVRSRAHLQPPGW